MSQSNRTAKEGEEGKASRRRIRCQPFGAGAGKERGMVSYGFFLGFTEST